MESDRFDRMARAIAASMTRRRALVPLSALGVAGMVVRSPDADAKKKGKKKKKKCKGGKKKCGKKCIAATSCCTAADCDAGEACTSGACRGSCVPDCAGKECGDDGCGGSCGSCPTGTSCQSGTCEAPPHVCAGKNYCQFNDHICGSDGSCYCMPTAGTDAPFCGQPVSTFSTNCNECEAGQTCVDVSFCGPNFTTACAVPCPSP